MKRRRLKVGAALASLVCLGVLVWAGYAHAEHPWAYRIAPGDTLQTIASRFGLPIEDIMRANGLASDDTLYAGERLLIRLLPASTHHIVARGEILEHIAARYSVSPAQLAFRNGLLDRHSLRAGQTLAIPDSEATQPDLQIAIARPRDGQRVGREMKVSGWGRSYDNALTVELRDMDGTLLAARSAAVHAEIGQLGPFSTTLVLPDQLPSGTGLQLVVRCYSNSGHITALENVSLILSP